VGETHRILRKDPGLLAGCKFALAVENTLR